MDKGLRSRQAGHLDPWGVRDVTKHVGSDRSGLTQLGPLFLNLLGEAFVLLGKGLNTQGKEGSVCTHTQTHTHTLLSVLKGLDSYYKENLTLKTSLLSFNEANA